MPHVYFAVTEWSPYRDGTGWPHLGKACQSSGGFQRSLDGSRDRHLVVTDINHCSANQNIDYRIIHTLTAELVIMLTGVG
jgi:hypothetical protein